MKNRAIRILEDTVSRRFLPYVRRPSRYIGGEVNQIKKDLTICDTTVALCFPDAYEIAMSHTGLAILYDVINQTRCAAAERAFAPWLDAEDIMRKNNIPLFTLESKAAVADFDIVGFSLTTELCYSNLLNMLDLAAIPLRTRQRTEDHPLIIAGGEMAHCCEPAAEFIDLVVIGEAEEAIGQLISLFKEHKAAGSSKSHFLAQAAAQFPWAYVPSLYEFKYAGQSIKSFSSINGILPTRFTRATIDNLDSAPAPAKPIVPFAETVHERVSIEIMRGCPGRCRFCQATFCRRPLRYRTVDNIVDLAKKAWQSTGFDTVSLLSLSTGDYPQIAELVGKLQDYFQNRRVGISLPSLRVRQQLKLIPQLVTSVRKPGLTIAVEAATEKLRNIINKPLTNQDLFAAAEAAYRAGFGKIKLYFIVGLPGETQDDVAKIAELANSIAILRRKVDGKTAQVNVTISWLVPKPHTPFAWLGQRPKPYFQNARTTLLSQKQNLRAKTVHFKFHNIDRSILESAMARADRRAADIVETAWRLGTKFDLWDECFDFDIWKRAFSESGLDLEESAQRTFATDEILPWQHLAGPKKDYLLRHLADALAQIENDPPQ